MLDHTLRIKKEPEIFIVSSGRSGTTLLVKILNASKQISIPYESDFVIRAYPFYSHRIKLVESDYEKLIRIFERSSQPAMWNMSRQYLISYLKEQSPQNFVDVISCICKAYHINSGTEDACWGMKAPVLISNLGRIFHLFPKCKVIHIVRDGRDVCLSYQSVHANSSIKFGPRGVIENALYWIDGLRRIERLSDNRIYELRYEDLIARPDKELRKLCGFLGVNYTPVMHEKYQFSDVNKKLFIDDSLNTIHAKLNQELDPSNSRKYIRLMSKLAQFKFELFAAPYLYKYNYELVFPYLKSHFFTPVRLVTYFMARQINNFRYSLRDRRICSDN